MPGYSVFLSHNSADKTSVEELARRLVKSGIQPWLDTWNLIPGEPWQEAIENALDHCATCAVFIGPGGTGPWQNEEMRAAIDRRVRESQTHFRVIPVLLPGAERGKRSRLPSFLVATTWVEFRRSLDDEDAFHRLVCGIRGDEPGPGPGQEIYEGECPYRGLQFFDVEHAPFFFGREALTGWLLDALQRNNRFLAIIGPSGSGKSSLARAGLVAALRSGGITGSTGWPITICRPGRDPLESLAVALCAIPDLKLSALDVSDLADKLTNSERTLHQLVRVALHDAPADHRLVVLVDQFEEVLTLCQDEKLRQALIDNLLYAISTAEGQTVVLLALRADFYGKCASYPALAAALSDHQLLVGPMSEDELRRAIERPAQMTGCEFESGLVGKLLDDVRNQAGGLPFLQHALLELWERREGRLLTHAAYQDTGGVAGALERRAEAIYSSLRDLEKDICRRIFLRLTQPGEGTEDTKRRASLLELTPARGEQVAVETVVNILSGSDARLITVAGEEDLKGERFIEVAHEALISGWSRLRRWVDQDRDALRTHRRLTDAASEWERKGRDESYLYGGARLREAEEWAATRPADLSQLEREFLNASLSMDALRLALDTLRGAGNAVMSTLDLDQVIEIILDQLQRVVPYDAATMQVLASGDDNELVTVQARGWDDLKELSDLSYHVIGDNPIALVLETRRPIVIPDVQAAYGSFREPPFDRIRSWLGVPLIFGDNLLGTIALNSVRPGSYTQEDAQLALALANQAAVALQNARLFQSEQERRQLADTFREVAAVVSSTLSVDRVITEILDQLRQVVPYNGATVQVLGGEQLVITWAHGWGNTEDPLGLAFPVEGDNPNSIVVRTQAPHIIPDVQSTYAHFREPPHNHIRSWLGIPLLYGDNLLGMIALDSVELDHFTQEHAQLALTFANQVAVALQNAQLFEQARQYADRLRVINEVGVEFTSILSVDELIARVIQLVEQAFGYRATIALIEEDYLVWRTHADQENGQDQDSGQEETYSLKVGDRGITGWAVESGETVVAPDASHDPHRFYGPGPHEDPTGDMARAEVAIPLKVQDRIIGVFNAQSEKPESFNENEVLVLQALANQVAVAISNAQLFEHVSQLGQELEQRVQERTEALVKTLEDLTLERDRVETLYRITRELSASLDLDRVMGEALALINSAVSVSHGSILLVDPGTGNLIYRAALGRSKGLPRGGIPTRYRQGVGLAGWVVETREPVIVPDVTQDPRWIPNEHKTTPERKSAMAVPLMADDLLGVLLLFHPEVDYFTTDHLKLVSTAATQVATAINNAELYRLITGQAERLGAMLRSLQAEGAKLEAIVEGIADGVLVLDANRQVILMNTAAARTLGLDASAVEGQHLREILGRAESSVDQTLARQLYDKLVTGMEPFGSSEWSHEGEPQSLDFRLEADQKIVVVNLSPVSLTSGQLPTLVAVLRDISREAEVERLKEEVISTVSRELRTPMTFIKGYAELLVSERAGTLSEQQRHFIQVIKNNADRLTGLVNDILDISRIKTGRIKLQIEPLDLRQLINDVLDNFRGQMVEKSLELKLDLPATLPLVRGDESRVTQILENLTSNAWKFTPEGGKVTIRAQVVDYFVQVDVADTGIGIDPKSQPQIFDRFYRTEQAEVQAVDGGGLGLSIVKMFVELLGGQIWVNSALGRGSTFSFTLPLDVETPLKPIDEGTTGPKVLVVDDNASA
jgi:PAS domain S-box-containing protein